MKLSSNVLSSDTERHFDPQWQTRPAETPHEMPAKCDALKAAWHSRIVQVLVEVVAECDVLKAA